MRSSGLAQPGAAVYIRYGAWGRRGAPAPPPGQIMSNLRYVSNCLSAQPLAALYWVAQPATKAVSTSAQVVSVGSAL